MDRETAPPNSSYIPLLLQRILYLLSSDIKNATHHAIKNKKTSPLKCIQAPLKHTAHFITF